MDPDDDNDGFADRDEIRADTDPHNASSLLMITQLSHSEACMWLAWKGGSGVTEVVERCERLYSPLWEPLYTSFPPTLTNQAIPIVPTNRSEFYRVRIVP